MSDNLPTTAERKPSYAAVDMEQSGGGGMLVPRSLGDVVAFAAVMARADIALPKHLRNNDGACMAVAMQALRWEMDPFAVANKSYSVNDRLAYEAQLIAAVVHTRAPIKGRPDYIYSGEGAKRRCQVVVTMADGETREYTSPEVGKITTKNSPLWKADEDQQLGYFAIRSWARRHTPEVILGVYTPEEVETFRDVTPQKSGLRERLEAQRDGIGGTATGGPGFSADVVTEALKEPVQDAEVVDLNVDTPSEEPVVVKDDTPPEPEGAPSDPLAIDILAATADEQAAWVEAFRAAMMRHKTAAESRTFWARHFDSHVAPLREINPLLHERLDRWMTDRNARLREKEAAS